MSAAPRRTRIAPWRSLTCQQRRAVEEAWPDLLAAACEARRTGWIAHERDHVMAAARAAGVMAIWPTAFRHLNFEAARLVAAPLPTNPRRY
jgi:hypothetical protein